MKYMGHKGKLIPLLADIFSEESKFAKRIADPFCGSGAVSWHLAQSTNKIVVSGDLQSYAVMRAAAVTQRIRKIDAEKIMIKWFSDAQNILTKLVSFFPNEQTSVMYDEHRVSNVPALVARSRRFCSVVLPPLFERLGGSFPTSSAYGGHYFSPLQALQLDALRQTVPKQAAHRDVCIAALVEAAGKCAAAPGHTAQPFQPTPTAERFLIEAWNRDVWHVVKQSLVAMCDLHAQVKGEAYCADYTKVIQGLEPGDLVFADPPYSDVHYSRFYHVLETLARGVPVTVSGSGRYPDISERPSSLFSQKGKAQQAAKSLVDSCAERELGLVLTFPSAGASNGLTAEDFMSFGRARFSKISAFEVDSNFSTLGGTKVDRGGRKACKESIVCFRP